MKPFFISALALLLCFPVFSKNISVKSNESGLRIRMHAKGRHSEINAVSSLKSESLILENPKAGHGISGKCDKAENETRVPSRSSSSENLNKKSHVSKLDRTAGIHKILSGNTNGLISLLLGAFGGLMGFIGLFLGPFTILCGLFSIIGIIVGIIGLKKDEKKTMSTIGIVWNSINFLLGTISLIAWIALVLLY